MNGESIGAADVSRLVTSRGLSPRAALDELVRMQLLSEEAGRRGLDRRADVVYAQRQALVRAVLASEIERVRPSEADIVEAYEQQATRFNVPEQRKSLHVLLSVGPKEPPERHQRAERLVSGVVSELLAAADPTLVWKSYQGRPDLDGFTVRAEDLPATQRVGGQFVPEFNEALFSIPGVGVVPKPVRTSFGWHAVFVEQVIAATTTTLDEARETLRAELTIKQRKDALDAWIATLRARHKPVENEALVQAVLHADEAMLGLK